MNTLALITEILQAVGAIVIPLTAIYIGHLLSQRKRLQERQDTFDQSLLGDRKKVFDSVLEPFEMILMNDLTWSQDKRSKKGKVAKEAAVITLMASPEYRSNVFRLALIAPDDVVLSLRTLIKTSQDYTESSASPERMWSQLDTLGEFFLSVRKGFGNEATKLTARDMIDLHIND